MNECLGVGFQRTHALNVVYSVKRLIHVESLSQSDLSFSEDGPMKRPEGDLGCAHAGRRTRGFLLQNCQDTMAVYDISPNTHL